MFVELIIGNTCVDDGKQFLQCAAAAMPSIQAAAEEEARKAAELENATPVSLVEAYLRNPSEQKSFRNPCSN